MADRPRRQSKVSTNKAGQLAALEALKAARDSGVAGRRAATFEVRHEADIIERVDDTEYAQRAAKRREEAGGSLRCSLQPAWLSSSARKHTKPLCVALGWSRWPQVILLWTTTVLGMRSWVRTIIGGRGTTAKTPGTAGARVTNNTARNGRRAVLVVLQQPEAKRKVWCCAAVGTAVKSCSTTMPPELTIPPSRALAGESKPRKKGSAAGAAVGEAAGGNVAKLLSKAAAKAALAGPRYVEFVYCMDQAGRMYRSTPAAGWHMHAVMSDRSHLCYQADGQNQ